MKDIPVSTIPAANVSQVPKRSLLRYPGGKTWLIPHIREWLDCYTHIRRPLNFVEPFLGGGSISLTVAAERLASYVHCGDIDAEVSNFWDKLLAYPERMIEMVREFDCTRENVDAIEAEGWTNHPIRNAFRTLVLNRCRYTGRIGGKPTAHGKSRKITTHWNPNTLCTRIDHIWTLCKPRMNLFCEHDATHVIRRMTCTSSSADTLLSPAIFVDPPYTLGSKHGERLYDHSKIDHTKLWGALVNGNGADFLMTYDLNETVLAKVEEYGFHAVKVAVTNNRNVTNWEVVITNRRLFRDPSS